MMLSSYLLILGSLAAARPTRELHSLLHSVAAPLLPSPAGSCDDGQLVAGICPSPSLPSLLTAFNYPFLPPTQLLMTSHLQPQGLEGSCRHHLPKPTQDFSLP